MFKFECLCIYEIDAATEDQAWLKFDVLKDGKEFDFIDVECQDVEL